MKTSYVARLLIDDRFGRLPIDLIDFLMQDCHWLFFDASIDFDNR